MGQAQGTHEGPFVVPESIAGPGCHALWGALTEALGAARACSPCASVLEALGLLPPGARLRCGL